MTRHPDTFDRLHIPAGTLLFSEGDPGECAFLIKQGEIEIFLHRDERDILLARRQAGEIIGEMAIIDRKPRSASARVKQDCEVVVITAEQIAHRIANTDPVLRMCLGVVLDRYRETVALVQAAPEPAPGEAVRPAEPAFQQALDMLTVERELERALREGELEIYFQPIVELAQRRLAGFETLMCWNHPRRGLVNPGDFIPIAEASGLIVPMTEWCLREVTRLFPDLALAALRNLSENGRDAGTRPALFVSVNVTGHDLLQPGFAETVRTILDAAGVAASSLKLEVTESMLMKDPAGAGRVLEKCRRSGMGIAVDDFGTGYSSLSYLSTLPITTLKIDRAFVRSMRNDPTSRKIVSTILNLARELEVPVVAEGIEAEEDAETLAAMGCAFGQGYLWSRPARFADALALVRAWRAPRRRPVPARRPAWARRAD